MKRLIIEGYLLREGEAIVWWDGIFCYRKLGINLSSGFITTCLSNRFIVKILLNISLSNIRNSC